MTISTGTDFSFLQESKHLVDRLLDRYLPHADSQPQRLNQAMRYSALAGGKRIRPLLALAAYTYCGGSKAKQEQTIYPAMAALELVHTYSLIHDDLPCMDDDDLRRGMPTCHKKFGEAIAVLAGDGLHVIAFQLMAQTGSIAAVEELSMAVGTEGMLGGQVADLEAEGEPIDLEGIVNIHRRKTGMLIRGSVRVGALLAGAPESTLARLTSYGEKVGLAFQIVDDILDLEGDQEILGKQVGSDCKNAKATYPATVGMARAKADAAALIDQALGLFEPYEENDLTRLAMYIGRRNG